MPEFHPLRDMDVVSFCFYFAIITNKAAMDIYVQFFCEHTFS